MVIQFASVCPGRQEGNPGENTGVERKGLREGVHEFPEMSLEEAKPFVEVGGTLDLLAQERDAVGVDWIMAQGSRRRIRDQLGGSGSTHNVKLGDNSVVQWGIWEVERCRRIFRGRPGKHE